MANNSNKWGKSLADMLAERVVEHQAYKLKTGATITFKEWCKLGRPTN